MSRSRYTLTAFAAAVLTLASLFAGTGQAFGQRPPEPDGGPATVPIQQPVQLHTITHGSPIWVFVLVALAAAAVTAAAVLAALKLRHSARLSPTQA